LRFTADTGQVESRASAYWRQRVQPVAPVSGRRTRNNPSWPEAGQDPVHGPALYVTLSPQAQTHLEGLRRELAARRG
jgi:hypothetical protein